MVEISLPWFREPEGNAMRNTLVAPVNPSANQSIIRLIPWVQSLHPSKTSRKSSCGSKVGLHISIGPRQCQTRDVVGGILHPRPEMSGTLQKQARGTGVSIRSVETPLSFDLVSCTAKYDFERAEPSRRRKYQVWCMSNHGLEAQERDGLRITMGTTCKCTRIVL